MEKGNQQKALILLVDDQPGNLQVVGTVLGEQYKIAVAGNGDDALKFVQHQTPDLILLDIMLPDRDGFAMCQRLKATPATRDIPVIFLTAHTDSTDLVKGFEVGAVDYITKPIQAQEVLARVKMHLHNHALQQQLAAHNLLLQQEIAKRTRVEEALAEERNLLRTVIDLLPDSIFVKDLATRFILNNTAHLRVLGATTQEEVFGETDFDRFPQELAAQYAADEQFVTQTIEPLLNHEERVLLPDGDQHWFLTTKVPLRNRQGAVIGVVGISRNITAQKQAEEQLRKLSRAVEQSASTIMITDLTGKIEFANPAFTRITGYSLQEAIAQGPHILKSGQHSPEFYQELWATIRRGDVWQGEFINKKKNGDLYWEAATISPIKDARGNITHYVAVKEDITARKQAEMALAEERDLLQAAHQELQTKNEQLRELNAGKDKFFSIIAHDLRSPFNALLGFIGLMSSQFDTLPPDKLKDYLAKVRLSAERLYALLENLLTWSRIQRGLVEYTPEMIDLAGIADDIVALFTSSAEHKQIALTSLIRETNLVHADYAMVNTIMRNLVSNALKFTPPGGRITLAAQPNADHVEVAVADTGHGMSLEVIAKLFRIDSQHTTTGTAGETGTGLGLILCHELAQKNGGTIWVESVPGNGTTFRFILPKASAVETAEIMLRRERRIAKSNALPK